MKKSVFSPALALPVLAALALPAAAQPVCSAGEYVAEAHLTLPEMAPVEIATQFAWDGADGIVEVCNLLSSTGDFAEFWYLFSGEISEAHGGICIRLTGEDGAEMFSCATPEVVAAAYAATPGTEESILRFEDWQAEVMANITE